MSEQREEYAAGAGTAAESIQFFIQTAKAMQAEADQLKPPMRTLSQRTDLDIQVKRAGGTSLHISHYKSGDSLTATEQGIFVGALWLSWAEVGEIKQAVQ